ncbi:MAG: VWA domain-containing protein [Candidatus Zixiibacteriota bacterium]|nr:MAG: VWA domain-containing protein [candidate division Zixibacteria bacterium]
MRFYHSDFLMLFLLYPLLFLMIFMFFRLRKQRINRLGHIESLKKLLLRFNPAARNISIFLLVIGFSFIIAALARPQYPGGVEKIEARGGKIVIALDISLSMLAPDFQPNRLEKAKREIIDLVEMLKAQTLGLVIFAGEAFVQCPPTIDYSAFRLFLDVADVGMISDTGTNIEDAIEKSVKLLDDDSPVDKAIVIFTDGESFEGEAGEAASEAAKKGIKVYTVGIGSTRGRPIPDLASGGESLKKNKEGEIIVSRLDAEELTAIASAGKGKFYRATPGGKELEGIYADIKGLQGEEKDKKFRTLYNEKYKWALLPGITFISISLLIPLSRRKTHA